MQISWMEKPHLCTTATHATWKVSRVKYSHKSQSGCRSVHPHRVKLWWKPTLFTAGKCRKTAIKPGVAKLDLGGCGILEVSGGCHNVTARCWQPSNEHPLSRPSSAPAQVAFSAAYISNNQRQLMRPVVQCHPACTGECPWQSRGSGHNKTPTNSVSREIWWT